eukprot:1195303-Prorocentrum_minimum.AAC.5
MEKQSAEPSAEVELAVTPNGKSKSTLALAPLDLSPTLPDPEYDNIQLSPRYSQATPRSLESGPYPDIPSPFPEISSPFTGTATDYPEFSFSPRGSPFPDDDEIRSASSDDGGEHQHLIPSTSEATLSSTGEPTRQPWATLIKEVAWPIIIPNTLVWLNEGMVTVLLPLVGVRMGCSEHTVGLLASGAQFGRVAANPLAGRGSTQMQKGRDTAISRNDKYPS